MPIQFPPPWASIGPSTPPSNADIVTAAYNYIGRTGTGAGPAQIDNAGFMYWLGKLEGGMSQQAFAKNFCAAVNNVISQPSTDPVVDYVRGFVTANHVKLVGLYDF